MPCGEEAHALARLGMQVAAFDVTSRRLFSGLYLHGLLDAVVLLLLRNHAARQRAQHPGHHHLLGTDRD